MNKIRHKISKNPMYLYVSGDIPYTGSLPGWVNFIKALNKKSSANNPVNTQPLMLIAFDDMTVDINFYGKIPK